MITIKNNLKSILNDEKDIGFSIKDLKTGDIVEFRKGENGMVFGDVIKTAYFLDRDKYLCDINAEYNEQLMHEHFTEYDIVKVYRIKSCGDISIKDLIDSVPVEMVDLIWEKERTIDWDKVPRFTRVQVRDKSYEDWENKYFLGVLIDNNGHEKYLTTNYGEHTYVEGNCSSLTYQKIKLYDENDLDPVWYK